MADNSLRYVAFLVFLTGSSFQAFSNKHVTADFTCLLNPLINQMRHSGNFLRTWSTLYFFFNLEILMSQVFTKIRCAWVTWGGVHDKPEIPALTYCLCSTTHWWVIPSCCPPCLSSGSLWQSCKDSLFPSATQLRSGPFSKPVWTYGACP